MKEHIRSRGRIRTTAATAAILACGSILGPLVTAAPANAKCDMASWTFPFCKVGKPSIPRINMGGPRPPLTQKNSVWCTSGGVIDMGGGIGWYPINRIKHDISFWPDYVHIDYVGVWNQGRGWVQPPGKTYTSADCDT